MIYNPKTEYILQSELVDTVTHGYQYIILHDDAKAIPIQMSKTAIYNKSDDSMTGRFLGVNDIDEALGHLFVPVGGYIDVGYSLIHWCFDEKRIDGKYEQDYLKEMLIANGFVNIRDINNDGINDTNIEDLDWDAALALENKYFCFVSAREVQHVRKVEYEQ